MAVLTIEFPGCRDPISDAPSFRNNYPKSKTAVCDKKFQRDLKEICMRKTQTSGCSTQRAQNKKNPAQAGLSNFRACLRSGGFFLNFRVIVAFRLNFNLGAALWTR
jgi:hypothetical protein